MQDARPPGQDQLTAEVTAAAAPVPPQDVVELFDKEVGVAYVLRVTTLEFKLHFHPEPIAADQ